MRHAIPTLLLLAFWSLGLIVHATLADRALRLTVTPAVSFAPARLAISVHLQPAPSDRWIAVWTDNGEFRRESSFSIEGDRQYYSWSWAGVPAGEFDVLAAVGAGDLTRAADKVHVIVSGP